MTQRTLLPEKMVKSCMWQMLNGLHYIHSNWVVHRDMKPANVMVMGTDSICPGQVKIGDFGLARVIRDPAASLDDNGVVVTIWYRAPELLFMSKHYTTAIDIWAAGCIFGELLTCVPMFRGAEVQHAAGQPPPFQEAQVRTIFERLGTPSVPLFETLPMWKEKEVGKWSRYEEQLSRQPGYKNLSPAALDLLRGLLHYDPAQRLTAKQALEHKYFRSEFSTTKFVVAFTDQQSHHKLDHVLTHVWWSRSIFSSYDPTMYPKRPRYVPNPQRPPPKQPQMGEAAQGQAPPQYVRVGPMGGMGVTPPPSYAASAQRGRGVGMQPQPQGSQGPMQRSMYMQQQQQPHYPPQQGRVAQTQGMQYAQAHQQRQMPMPPQPVPSQMDPRQPRQQWAQQQMQPQNRQAQPPAPPPPTRRRKTAAAAAASQPNPQAPGPARGYAP